MLIIEEDAYTFVSFIAEHFALAQCTLMEKHLISWFRISSASFRRITRVELGLLNLNSTV